MAFAQPIAIVGQRMANMMHHVMIPLLWINYTITEGAYACICTVQLSLMNITLQQIRMYLANKYIATNTTVRQPCYENHSDHPM